MQCPAHGCRTGSLGCRGTPQQGCTVCQKDRVLSLFAIYLLLSLADVRRNSPICFVVRTMSLPCKQAHMRQKCCSLIAPGFVTSRVLVAMIVIIIMHGGSCRGGDQPNGSTQRAESSLHACMLCRTFKCSVHWTCIQCVCIQERSQTK